MGFNRMPDLVKGILYLLVILSVLVVAHELGHFLVAKWFRMRVEEFSLFFGPVLLRLGRRGGTEYNLRAVPLGGFVRIAGMEPDDVSGGRPLLEAVRHPRFVQEETTEQVLRQLDSDTMAGLDATAIGPEVRTFVHTAVGRDGRLTAEGREELRAMREAATVNEAEQKLLDMVLNADARADDEGLYSQKPLYQRALVILAGPVASLLFGYLVFCVMGMTVGLPRNEATNQVLEVRKDGAAKAAGMRIGDRIVAINGNPTPDGKSMVDTIHNGLGKRLVLTVERSGETFLMAVTPRPFTVEEGGKKETVGIIGIIPDLKLRRFGPAASIRAGTLYTVGYLRQIAGTFTNGRRVRETVGGPIAMGQMATAVQRLGIAHLLMMSGAFSLSLGIFNLLPIPILDGGHLVLLAVEKLRRRKLSPREVYRAQMIGVGILALIVTLVMYNDISRTLAGKALQ